MRPSRSIPSVRHRGSIYIAALATAMLMSVIGLSTLMVQRIDNRKAMTTSSRDEATLLAMTAVEHALTEVTTNVAFRTAYTHNVPITPKAFGTGTFEWKLVDEVDGDLADSDDDPVTIMGTGKAGGATRVYSVKLAKQGGTALDVLYTAVHAGGDLNVITGLSGNNTVTGGPISSNDTLSVGVGSNVSGDAQAMTFFNGAAISGNKTTLPAPLPMPNSNVFTSYKARATTINYFSIPSGTMEGVVLSPNNNPYGTETNPEGIYYIRIPYRNYTLKIRDARIVGTLIVELDEKDSVRIDGPVVWEPAAPNLPMMIVKALSSVDTEVRIKNSGNLVESTFGWTTNFNPPDLPPLDGSTDNDVSDSFPSRIKGLIHVIRQSGDNLSVTEVNGSGTKNVVVVADGLVEMQDATVSFDPSVAANLPDGYGGGNGSLLLPVSSSWKRRMANE